MFCKQKGYLEEELDYRKQALDQAYMVCCNNNNIHHHHNKNKNNDRILKCGCAGVL